MMSTRRWRSSRINGFGLLQNPFTNERLQAVLGNEINLAVQDSFQCLLQVTSCSRPENSQLCDLVAAANGGNLRLSFQKNGRIRHDCSLTSRIGQNGRKR